MTECAFQCEDNFCCSIPRPKATNSARGDGNYEI